MTKLSKLIGVFFLLVTVAMSSLSFAESSSYSVTIAPDLEPRMTPEEVATVVLNNLARPISGLQPDGENGARIHPRLPKVLSIACTTGDTISEHLPTYGKMRRGILWVVRAEGRFSKSKPGGGSSVRDYGHMVIEDSTGRIIGYGSSAEDAPAKGKTEKTVEQADSRYFWKVDGE